LVVSFRFWMWSCLLSRLRQSIEEAELSSG
jgi:hypothetical protein